MESDPATEGTQEVTVIPSDYQKGVHQQDHPQADTSQTTTGSHRRELEDGWQRDATTLTEEEYIRKHYYDKAEQSNSGIPMNMYLGLRIGHLLSASLLLAITKVQLQRNWHGMRCCDILVKTQPQANGHCSPTSPRSRAEIRSTEVMCIVHISPICTTAW